MSERIARIINRVTAAQALEEVLGSLRAGEDAPSVLKTLLSQISMMLEADESYVALLEGQTLRVVASVGLGGSREGQILGFGLESIAVAGNGPLTVFDAGRSAEYHDYFDRRTAVGAFLACPIITQGKVDGVIVAARHSPGHFGGSDLWWVQLLGGLAGVVLANERSRRQQEHRARQAEVLLDVASLSGGEPAGLMQKLAELLTRDLGVSRVDVLLRDDEREDLVCLGSACGPADPGQSAALGAESGRLLRSVLESGTARVWSATAAADPLPGPLRAIGARSALATPVLVDGRGRGILLLSSVSPDSFGVDDQAFAAVVAARVGLLIEEASLIERRRELDRLSTETRARQEFVGVISHELKTPVAVIQAYTDVLRRRAEKSGASADLDVLRRIGDQVERMLHMVDQTLDLQRLEAGLMSLESSRFDLGALAGRVVDEMSALTAQHRLTVQIDSTLPVMVMADRRRVEEVLTNLLQNAIKFSTSGAIATRIWQNDSVTDPMAYVSVSDQGPGIAVDQQERVFERFYQGVERLYRGHVGLGLGLHISREIVRRHGGDIRLTSQPEQGATFTFWLPVGGPDSGEP